MINPERLKHMLALHDILQVHLVQTMTGCHRNEAMEWLANEVKYGRLTVRYMAYHETHPDVPIGEEPTDFPFTCPECEREIWRPDDLTIEPYYYKVKRDEPVLIKQPPLLELPAGRDLDLSMGLLMGWTFQKIEWTANDGSKDWMWVLVAPNGQRAGFGSSISKMEALKAADSRAPDVGALIMPHWSTDMNDAIRLPLLGGETLHYHCDMRRPSAERHVAFIESATQYLGSFSGAEPALMVCRAWLYHRAWR